MTNIDKKIFDLKLAAKQITRNANKLKKEEAREMQKCFQHVMRGEHDIGRVHAENAVRNHNQSLDLLKLGARLQGAVNVLQVAIVQNSVTKAMKSVVLSMASATHNMNFPTLTKTMTRFERMTDHLNVRQAHMNEALNNTDNGTDTDQIEHLMAQMVDRAGLDVKNEMPGVECSQSSSTPLSQPSQSPLADTGLDEKLAKLRNDYHL